MGGQVRAAIVTCGGLCPGINDVVRQIVYTLDVYGVKDIQGVQYGFKGFVDASIPPIKVREGQLWGYDYNAPAYVRVGGVGWGGVCSWIGKSSTT